MRGQFVSLCFLCVLVVSPAQGSAPAAWSAVERAGRAACLAKSGFARAAASPAVVRFSDRTGVDAWLVTGLYRQAHMQGRQGLMLCLYDRRTKTAEAQDAEAWWAGRTR